MNRNNIVNLLSVRVADNDLTESSSFRLISLLFCKDLSWTGYISFIAKSASMKIGPLFRDRGYLTNQAIVHIYNSC